MPDATIFDEIDFNGSTEIARMKQSAYLTPGVTFTFINEKDNIRQRFYFE
jgi:DNA gyrase/topoisomerase IV subunit B